MFLLGLLVKEGLDKIEELDELDELAGDKEEEAVLRFRLLFLCCLTVGSLAY